MEYEDFELQIGPQLDEGLLVRVRSPAGDGEALAQLPKFAGDLEQLAGRTRHLIGEAAGLPSAPEAVGSELFRAVFIGQVSDLLQRSLSRVEAMACGLRLRIRINLRDRTLAPLLDWPWELLYRQETEEFLALSRGTPIVRALDVPRPSAVRRYQPPLRILAVLARDPESSPLGLEEELKQLRESLTEDPEIQLEILDDPDTQTLRNILDQKEIHILHYMGHGVFEPAGGEGALLFGSPEGRIPVTGRHLAAKVKDLDALRLVVLNACETAVIAGEAAQGPFAGVAAALVLSGLHAVVAMQSSIMDVHSVAFTAAFYRRLARGMSVEEAVTEGRQAILSQEPESAAWAIPVLFLRAAGALFVPERFNKRVEPLEMRDVNPWGPASCQPSHPPDLSAMAVSRERARIDVFLSHNRKDKPAVRELAEALRARGLKVWLDEWELVPGRPWQEALEEVIENTRSSAVLVGNDGLGPWQNKEMRGCLSEFVDRDLPVIPVLLPGAQGVPRLPIFLKRFTWVDLRGGLTEEGIDRLQWGITGEKPDRPKPSATQTEAPEVTAVPPTASAEALSAAAAMRPAMSEIETPATAATERPNQKAGARWGLLAWIGLLVLLGITVFLFAQYFPRQEQKQGPDRIARKPTSRDVAPAPASAATCVPKEEREEAGIVFVRMCPGTFSMGSAENDPQAYGNEKPAHEVTLSEFWIGKTEITNKQYRRYQPDHQGQDELPAVDVSWTDAKAACEHFGGRLPTEAEWEYAARAGRQTAWSFGDDEKLLGNYAWYEKNAGGTPHPVGMKEPNDWGLHDMHGNVWEWVADWYGMYPATAKIDPTGPPEGEYRVLRGASFAVKAQGLRSADRDGFGPQFRFRYVGFRCARALRHPSSRSPNH